MTTRKLQELTIHMAQCRHIFLLGFFWLLLLFSLSSSNCGLQLRQQTSI